MKIDSMKMVKILLLRRGLPGGGGKPVQLSALGQELPCETTATHKVTVKPLVHTTAGTILIIVSFHESIFLLAMLGKIDPEWQRYLASQRLTSYPLSYSGAH